MDQDFLHWRKFARQDHSRACPLCGKAIRLATYGSEVAVRVLAAAVLIGAAYFARERGGGYVGILVTVVIVLGSSFGFVAWWLRDKQRFLKG